MNNVGYAYCLFIGWSLSIVSDLELYCVSRRDQCLYQTFDDAVQVWTAARGRWNSLLHNQVFFCIIKS